jgi:Holliday junction resolvase RusA-like endonuclease
MGMHLNPETEARLLALPGVTVIHGPPTLPLDTEETAALKSGLAKLATFLLPEADRFEVTFPLVTSTNNLYVNAGKGRVPAPDYENWRTAATIAMRNVKIVRVTSPVSITILVCGKVNRGSDLGNREKGTVDFLKSRGIIKDDNLKNVHELHMLYRPDDGEARIEVVVETLNQKEV